MNFIDTHVHLQDFKEIYAKDIISSAFLVGVNTFVCVSSKKDDFAKIENLYKKYPNYIVSAFGFHPWYAKDVKNEDFGALEELLKKYPEALIGEVGLDGYKNEEGQVEVFEKQLELAKIYSRAFIIHSVKFQSWFEKNWHNLPEKFVFHSYNGKKEFLKEIVSHGGYVSFSFSILQNKHFEEVVKMVPIDRLLLETDSPYQGIEKDVENEPRRLPNLFEEVAKIINLDRLELADRIYKNSLEFIGVGR